MTRRSRRAKPSAPQLIALTFALGCLLGAALLSLPFAHAPGKTVTLLQALFTATSALCVTGLTVLDTGSTFSPFGQVVILLLIQVGGLGIVTFGTLFAFFLGRRVGTAERLRLAQQISVFDIGSLLPLLRLIFVYTFTFELAGALLLLTRFGPSEGWGPGAYSALFHAVSAFNNAGFSLYPDSLVRYATDPVVNVTVSLLVLLGGFGFVAFVNLLSWRLSPRRNPLLTTTRIALLMTGILLVVGTVGVGALEWTNPDTLGQYPWPQKLLVSFFEGVMPRTAGFNTLDYGAMRPATLFLTLLMMFVGANPGSTGGGVKTTTFFVMLVSAWSLLRGRGEPSVFQRRIDFSTVLRAFVVGISSLALINLMLALLVLTNPKVPFFNLAFETVSAYATVGLSMNTTPLLGDGGHLILALLMYLGRVGPLTFALALGQRTPGELVSYPAEKNILIG